MGRPSHLNQKTVIVDRMKVGGSWGEKRQEEKESIREEEGIRKYRVI